MTRAILGAVFAAALSQVASAQTPQAPSWTETKCIRYKTAWAALLKQRGLDGVGPEFIRRHDAFIANGCRESTRVCPTSSAEIEVADMMIVAAINGGMASTLPPFSCRP